MPRAVLEKGKQKEILEFIKTQEKLGWNQIANLCNVSKRSLYDWRREKYKIPLETIEKLCLTFNLQKPDFLDILSDNWGKVKGGKIVGRLIGCPATPEGRRKAALKRKEQRRPILFPGRSQKLSEFIGIMLGDGDISTKQISISLNLKDEIEYAKFVSNLITTLFGLKPSIGHYRSSGICRIRVSSLNLIDYLLSIGLRRGRKTNQQFNIGPLIIGDKESKAGFIRGLMDTEGSFYSYKHFVYKKLYENWALCLTNYSKSLLNLIINILKDLEFNPRIAKNRVYLYRKEEINRYIKEIGTNNSKHLSKFNNYLKYRRDVRVA